MGYRSIQITKEGYIMVDCTNCKFYIKEPNACALFGVHINEQGKVNLCQGKIEK